MKRKLFILVFLTPFIFYAQIQIGSDIDGEKYFDRSGSSVNISSDGNIVAIGAPGNDGTGGNGTDSGHVRVYKNISGVWTQIGQDIDGEAAGDYSGSSISLSTNGEILAIGAVRNSVNGNFTGHVRVYKNISNVWTQIGSDIDGEAAYDEFGTSVSLSSDGNIVAIGAPLNDGNGDKSGHVRVFKNLSDVWTQIGEDINGEAAEDISGWSVSISSDGNIVAISARGNDGTFANSGHVRVYKNESDVWTQIGQDIDGEALYDNSGDCISLSSDGNIIAIGATLNDGNGDRSGHVRIYKNESDVWTKIGEDIDGELESSSGFSISLSNNGSIIAIGALYFDDGTIYNIGHVRIYQNINDIWTQVGEDIIGEAANDNSGVSVSLSSNGATIAIGAHANDGNQDASGHVRVYDLSAIILSLEDNFINQNFTIFPNPVKEKFQLQLNNTLEFKNVKLYNVFGQQVLQSKKSIINVSSLSTGIYYVEVNTNQGKGVKKIIIE